MSRSDPDGFSVHFDLHGRDVIIRAQVKKTSAVSLYLIVRGLDLGVNPTWYDGFFGGEFGLGRGVQKKWARIAAGRSPRRYDGFFDLELSAIGNTLTLKAEGKVVAQAVGAAIDDGRIGLGAFRGVALFKRIEAKVLDKKM